jgi:hypothetical protein
MLQMQLMSAKGTEKDGVKGACNKGTIMKGTVGLTAW